MLKIIKADKSFAVPVLTQVDLALSEGTIFGLIGINGAGKTTLLRCIAGVYKLDGGEILFNEKNTYDCPEIRKDIIYVSDDPYFPFGATVASMKVFYSSFYHFSETKYRHYLEMFHLDEMMPISSFSKGMKRQVTLLFALSVEPKLLLLDEVFDGLDPLVRLNFKKVLIDLLIEKKITVIISSHNLKELEDICDSYGILENGHFDTYGDLLTSRDMVNKYQLAFKDEKKLSDFSQFEILHADFTGHVISLVIKGEKEVILEQLKQLDPLFLDELPVNFEEMFIYEMEARGYRE